MKLTNWFTKKQRDGITEACTILDEDGKEAGFVVQKDAVKVPGCAACENDIPIMVNGKGERKHFDFFATPEFGAFYDCPCAYEDASE